MGVAWVFENTTQSARAVELLFEQVNYFVHTIKTSVLKLIKKFLDTQTGAILHGAPKSFRVDCIWYRPQAQISSLITGFYLLHHSNFPDSAFIINANKSETSGQQTRFLPIPPRATADKGFELQLDKFQSAGLAADPTKFEIVGNEYQLKDFYLRVGTATFGSSVKGVIVELEFAPSNIAFQCHTLLQEIVDFFFPDHSLRPPEVLQRHSLQPDNYMPIDTLNQYLDIYVFMRKRS